MDNRCPKCGKKLSIFYLKQDCPECGCDLLYYDMENRLEQDAAKAEAEYDKFYALLDKLKGIFVRKKRDQQNDSQEEQHVD